MILKRKEEEIEAANTTLQVTQEKLMSASQSEERLKAEISGLTRTVSDLESQVGDNM